MREIFLFEKMKVFGSKMFHYIIFSIFEEDEMYDTSCIGMCFKLLFFKAKISLTSKMFYPLDTPVLQSYDGLILRHIYFYAMNSVKVKLGEFNALQQNFKSLNKYEKPSNKQMQDTESKKDAIKHDMRILNRWVADQYAKLLSYKVESMDIPTRDFTGTFDLTARIL